MDLSELSSRTGIDRRRLRYVLDHELVPALHIKIADDSVGRPRQFEEDVGFGIVCAARLLELGLRHDTIRAFLGGLLEIKLTSTDPFLALRFVLDRNHSAFADLGDGQRVRIRVINKNMAPDTDTGWIIPGQRSRRDHSFAPTGIVTLDIGRIRDEVYARTTKANRS